MDNFAGTIYSAQFSHMLETANSRRKRAEGRSYFIWQEKMQKIIFDSNIYNLIEKRPDLQKRIRNLVDCKKITVIVSNTIYKELLDSHYNGAPDWFDTSIQGDSVFISDYSLVDVDKLGIGNIYNIHKGESKKIRDAIIADCADTYANVFVTEDKRCRSRLKQITNDCLVLTFLEFESFLKKNFFS